MKVRIAHRTVYRYRDPPRHLVQTLRLTPFDAPGQRVLDWNVRTGTELWREIDAWGNVCHGHTVDRPGRVVAIHAGGEVETQAQADRVDHAGVEPGLYLRPSLLATADAAIAALARAPEAADGWGRAGQPVGAAFLLGLAERVCGALPYRSGVTHAATTASQALQMGAGVCQDHAHVFIAACRSLGLAARYVSGYFLSDLAEPVDQSGAAVQVHASHAWVEVCVAPTERRWLTVDVTHACLTDERHVRLAHGPDYSACLPVRGVRVGGDGETLEVEIHISRV
ncbi:MAG: hypothetical protein RL375_90 [Pseudomonadota bacterium]